MHAVVCIKSVPDTTEVRFNPETNTLMRDEVESIINPFDTYAIEEALRLKEAHGGKVTVITMGPPKAEKELKEAVAMGCDEAILLSAREFAGADTWANCVHAGGRDPQAGRCGHHPVRQAGDGRRYGTGGAGHRQSARHPTVDVRVPASAMSTSRARQLRWSGCSKKGARSCAPSCRRCSPWSRTSTSPRYPTFRGIRAARRLKVPVWSGDDLPEIDRTLLGLDGSPTKVIKVFTPPQREGEVEMIPAEDIDSAADALADRLLQDKVV